MKLTKKLLTLSLAGVMTVGLLAGCTAAPKNATPTTTPAANTEDMAFQAAGISKDTVMYTLEGVDVTADEYLFWVLSTISQQQQAGGLADDAAWAGEIEGQPAADFIKNTALETSKLYGLMMQKAAAAGVTLTAENQAEMDAQVTEISGMLMAQGLTYQDWLEGQCISEESFAKLNGVYFLNEGLMETLQVPGGELEMTPEKLQAFMDESGMYLAKHILLSTKNEDGTDFSAEEKAAVKATADALVAEIRAATDLEATFDEKMNALSSDPGLAQYPNGYVAYPNQMVPEFESAAVALAVGELSEPVATSHGYHIIFKPDPVANADVANTYAGYAMNDVLDTWLKEATVVTTEAFTALDPKLLYEKMTEINTARQAERDAAVAATASPAPQDTTAPAPQDTTAPAPTATPAP